MFRKTVLMFCLVSVPLCSLAQNSPDKITNQVDILFLLDSYPPVEERWSQQMRESMKAFADRMSLKEFSDTEISSYDCTVIATSKHRGKCLMQIKTGGREITLTASAEVAAPYSNSYGPREARPTQGLTILVKIGQEYFIDGQSHLSGEIIEIKDRNGITVSKKIDLTR